MCIGYMVVKATESSQFSKGEDFEETLSDALVALTLFHTCTVAYGSHQPHVTFKPLKCDWCELASALRVKIF